MKKLLKTLILASLVLVAISCGKPKVVLTTGEWKLMSMDVNGESMIITTNNPTISFSDSSLNINGYSGCNRFFGTYKVAGEHLNINLLGITQAMCNDFEIENNFMNILKKTTLYEIDDQQLVLYDSLDNSVAILTQNKIKE